MMTPQLRTLIEGIQARNGAPNWRHIEGLLAANELRHGHTFVSEDARAWFLDIMDGDDVVAAIVMRWSLSKQSADALAPSVSLYMPTRS